jgi:hypothetical protein
MARKNIFEILESKWNLYEELSRLRKLFEDIEMITIYGISQSTIRDFVDEYCFYSWKNRNQYIDVADYLDALEYSKLIELVEEDTDLAIMLVEIMYNFYYMAKSKMTNENYRFSSDFQLFKSNMDRFLDNCNHMAYIIEDKEQVIVIEKDPAATAVAEISNPETAFAVIQYNHHTLKGDIKAKKEIILHLAAKLEPKRTTLKGTNPSLADDIFTLLNNLNIRHNNIDPAYYDFKHYIASMSKEELENWYDELYQMILLANLEIDNLERKKRVTELKTHF